jgi:hypothetical protein
MLYQAGEGCSTHFFRIGVTLRDGQIISGWFALFRHGINGSSSRNQKKQKFIGCRSSRIPGSRVSVAGLETGYVSDLF